VSRVIAALVAVGLIVGAVVVRNVIDDDDGGSSGSTPETVRVVCAPEVYDACASLNPARYEVRREDEAVTAATLASGDPTDFDVWIAPQPWPAIVDDSLTRAGEPAQYADGVVPVARSPLVLVGATDAVKSCTWRCIADGKFSIGAAAPASGLGTLELGAAAAGRMGRSDFAANDFDSEFRTWVDAYTKRVSTNDRPVTTLLQSRAFFNAAMSSEAEARTALDAASPDRKAGLSLQYPSPMTSLDVVAVDVDPDRARAAAGVGRTLGALLLANGWHQPEDSSTNLPRPGVLTALRDLL